MSRASLALTLALCLLNAVGAAKVKSVISSEGVERSVDEWLSPVAGMLSVYGIDGTVSPESPRAASRHPEFTSFLSVSDSEAVVGANYVIGAGVGKSGQLTFAGAATAANKVADVAASSNALVSNAQAQTAAIVKTPLVATGWFAWLRLTLSLGFIVKSLCMILNIFYQASPLPLIAEYKTKGDTGEADLAPFIFLSYGGWQWCFYGTFAYLVTNKTGFLVLVYSNIVGAFMGIYYVIAFNANCYNKTMIARRSKYYGVLVCVMTSQFIAIETMPAVKALFFSGLVSSAWSTVSAASLISTVPKVIEQQNSKPLPLPLLLCGWISNLLWVLCGVMLWDPWITFPNAFGLGVCTFALCLCFMYPPFEDCDSPVLRQGSPQSSLTSPIQKVLSFVRLSSSRSEEQLVTETADDMDYGSASSAAALHSGGGTGDCF